MKRLTESILDSEEELIDRSKKNAKFQEMFDWIGKHTDLPFDWNTNDPVWNKLYSITNKGGIQFGSYGFWIDMAGDVDVIKSLNLVGDKTGDLRFATKKESINIDVQQIKNVNTIYITGANLKHIYLNGDISCPKLEIESRVFETIKMGNKVNILTIRTTTTSLDVGKCKFNKFLKTIQVSYDHDEEIFKRAGAVNAEISHHL